MYEMLAFQQNFFKNGAVPGLVLTTPNILGKKVKERLINYWIKFYNPKVGGRRPLILDGDFKVQTIAATNFKELDFEASVDKHEDKILTVIGVPPILLKGGNNANIKPNMQLLYFTTVLPIVNKLLATMEVFFGYDLALDLSKIASLQPELQQQSSYQTSLVNAGIITVNEAREALRFEKSDDPEADKLVKPANIAGSATNPSEGGRPPNEDN
jgi:HK97 family phage portal protein